MTGIEEQSGTERTPGKAVSGENSQVDPETSPIAGMDRQSFRNYLIRAIDGDQSVPPAILTLVSATLHGKADGEKERREQHWWEEFFWQRVLNDRLNRVQDLIDRCTQKADWHHDQAEQARGRMREATDKLQKIDEFVEGTNEALAEYKRTGTLDRERMRKLLKARGVDVDPNANDETLISLMRQEHQKTQQEKRYWSKQYETGSADAAEHDRQEREWRRQAEELKKQREAICSNINDPEEQARRLGALANNAEITSQRLMAEQEVAKGHAGVAQDIRDSRIKNFEGSQGKNEEADFLAAAEDLTAHFAAAANPVNSPAQPNSVARTLPAVANSNLSV